MKFSISNHGRFPIKVMTGSGSTPDEGETSSNGIEEVVVEPGKTSGVFDLEGKVEGVQMREMVPVADVPLTPAD